MTKLEPKDNPDELEESRMTLGEHLSELRVRLIRAAIALSVVFIAAWCVKEPVWDVAVAPFEEKARPWLNERLFEIQKEKLYADGEPTQKELEKVFHGGIIEQSRLKESILAVRTDGPSESFFLYLKVCGYAAMFLAGPFVLFQVWAFIAAGLYREERKAVYRYFPPSVFLFFSGVIFGYLVLVPYAYYFLAEIGLAQQRHDSRAIYYFSFLTSLGLGMGVVFQLPVLMMALSRVGFIDPKDYGKYRGHFVISSLVLASMLTPPDPYTMIMMAGPMLVLYEVGIVLARMTFRRANEDDLALDAP